jgi:hypothetical protein
MTPKLITELGLAISCMLTSPTGESIYGHITLNRFEIQRSSGSVAVQYVPICYTANISKLANVELENLDEGQRVTVESIRN